uniref:Glycosyl transferase, family 28 n=1 Tax=Solibacter usitatus (strain Ellin6076) TaxID=234267 RepID=Q024E7_SOLUE
MTGRLPAVDKITILCLGTRGDVQPYVALASALKQSGFTPKIAAPVNFEAFIKQHGIDYAPIDMNTEEGLKSPEGRAWLAAGNSRAFIRHLSALMKRHRRNLQKGCWEACQGANAIIGTAMTLAEAASLSEKLRLPMVASLIYPLLPRSSSFANFLVAAKSLPTGWMNSLTHMLVERMAFADVREDLNIWRAEMGLAPTRTTPSKWLRLNKTLTLHHYGEPLFQRPRDWMPQNVLTGPLFLNEAGTPASSGAKLTRFLEAGEPPAFLGFGSMPVLDPEAVLTMAARVTERLGIRAVVGAGWSQLGDSDVPKHMLLLKSVDHGRLFPKCRALVHHGGAGTTFAGLLSGRPAAVYSVFADQPFWGERLKQTGAGTHFRFSEFSEATLLKGLQRVLGPAVRDRAEQLGKQLEPEAGAENSVAEISRYLRVSRSGRLAKGHSA